MREVLSFDSNGGSRQDTANDLGKKCGVGPAVKDELCQSLSRVQRDITALFGGPGHIKPTRLQPLHESIPVRLRGDDHSRITSPEGRANKPAQFIKEECIFPVELNRVGETAQVARL